jgi:hypothetical protein
MKKIILSIMLLAFATVTISANTLATINANTRVEKVKKVTEKIDISSEHVKTCPVCNKLYKRFSEFNNYYLHFVNVVFLKKIHKLYRTQKVKKIRGLTEHEIVYRILSYYLKVAEKCYKTGVCPKI